MYSKTGGSLKNSLEYVAYKVYLGTQKDSDSL